MLELYKPDVNDLWFRKKMMSDEQTMSYNHAYGGTISFPEECWTDWYDRWLTNSNGQRFYRYIKENNFYIGEAAYYFDAERQIYIADVVIYAPYRGKGYGREGLLLLCEAAKENGVKELYDDIAVDNPSVSLFLKCGFVEVLRTCKYILVKKEMETIRLKKLTRELCHELYRNWENDASIYADMSAFTPYCYDKAKVDKYFNEKNEPSRIAFAIMLEENPIGEIQLKKIDREKSECTLSIHMQNDAVKGKGYGTQAECLAVNFAFRELGMSAVNADAIRKNTRSQHVLEKAGFRFVGEDKNFRYYRIERRDTIGC